MKHSDCLWVQTQHLFPSGAHSKWEWRQIDQVAGWSKSRQHRDVYATLQRYSKPDKLSPQSCPLAFDFDIENDSEFAMTFESVRWIRNFAENDLALPLADHPELFRLWFTGGRSWHVIIDPRVFGMAPRSEMVKLIKQAAIAVDERMTDSAFDALPMDRKIYSNPRQWRLNGCHRTDKDTYKIEVGWDEFFLDGLHFDRMMKAARTRRPPLYRRSTIEPVLDNIEAHDGIPEAREWLSEIDAQWLCEQERRVIDDTPLTKEDVAQRTQSFLEGNVQKGERNARLFQAACDLNACGHSREEALTLLLPAAQRLDTDPSSPFTELEVRNTVQSAFNQDRRSSRYGLIEYIPPDELPAHVAKDEGEASVDGVREKMLTRIGNYIEQYDPETSQDGLYVRATQGVGKSHTTEKAVIEVGARGIFVKPRHELIVESAKRIEENTPDPHVMGGRLHHIQPRVPSAATARAIPEMDALCQYPEEANSLRDARHNVSKQLCVSCEAYEKPFQQCPYHVQFDTHPQHVGVVQQLLAVEERMERITKPMEELPLYLPTMGEDLPLLKNVVVVDEPSVDSLMDTYTITASHLTRELEAATELITDGCPISNVRAVLDLLHRAVMKPYESKSSDRLRGRALYDLLTDSEGGKEGLPEALDATAIPLEVDSVEKHSANKRRYNFVPTLFEVMLEEAERYRKGEEFNGRITLRRSRHGNRLIVRTMRKPAIPDSTPLIVLDAHISTELLRRAYRREFREERFVIPPNCEVQQCLSGIYGVGSIWDKAENKPTTTGERLIEATKEMLRVYGSDTLIVTWKVFADHLKALQADSKFPAAPVVHYGALEGINSYQDTENVILIGTPAAPEDEVLEIAESIYHDEAPIDPTVEKVGVPYTDRDGNHYRDGNSRGLECRIRKFRDPRVQAIAEVSREQEMVQAIHRIRPVLAGENKKRVILFSALPLHDVPPTQVFQLSDVCPSLRGKTTYGLMSRLFDQIEAEIGGVSMAVVERVIADLKTEGYFSQGPLVTVLKEAANNTPTRSKWGGVQERTVATWLNIWAASRGLSSVSVPRLDQGKDGVLVKARGRPMRGYITAVEGSTPDEVIMDVARYCATGELPVRDAVELPSVAEYDDGGDLGFLYDAIPDDFRHGRMSVGAVQNYLGCVSRIDPGLGKAIRERLKSGWYEQRRE